MLFLIVVERCIPCVSHTWLIKLETENWNWNWNVLAGNCIFAVDKDTHTHSLSSSLSTYNHNRTQTQKHTQTRIYEAHIQELSRHCCICLVGNHGGNCGGFYGILNTFRPLILCVWYFLFLGNSISPTFIVIHAQCVTRHFSSISVQIVLENILIYSSS